MQLTQNTEPTIETFPKEVFLISKTTGGNRGFVLTQAEAEEYEDPFTTYEKIRLIGSASVEKKMIVNKILGKDNSGDFQIVRHEKKIKVRRKTKFLWFTTWNFVEKLENSDEDFEGNVMTKTMHRTFVTVEEAKEYINMMKAKKKEMQVEVLETV